MTSAGKLDLKQRVILVAEREYHPILLRQKEAHPEWNLKIVTPKEFLDLVSFRYTEDPIPALLKTGLDYDRAKKWLKILRLAHDADHLKIKEYWEIVSPFTTIDPYAQIELKRCNLAFFELQEDCELHGLCKRFGYSCVDLSFEDLGIEKQLDETKSCLPIASYRNKEEQFISVFSLLRKEVLDHPEKKNNICLHVDGAKDEFHLRFVSSLLGLPLFLHVQRPLRADGEIAALLSKIFQEKNLSLSEEERSSWAGAIFQGIIDQYDLASLPFEKAYIDLEEVLSSRVTDGFETEEGLLVSDRFAILPDEEIYVLDFCFGRFYKNYADNNVLSDAELAKIGVNPSYVLTLLDGRKKRNYLRYSKIAFLSLVREHQSDKIYPSQFVEEFSKANPSWQKATYRAEINEEGVFTTEGANFASANACDKAFIRSPLGEYRSYDPSFKGISETYRPKFDSWSISRIEKYTKCPYSFYMEKLIPSKDSDSHYKWLGTMFHKVMERIYDPDYDFETAFEEGKEAYRKEMEKEGMEISPQEETYFLVYHEVLKVVLAHARAMKQEMSYRSSWAEYSLETDLEGGDRKYPFKGSIDKLILVGDDERSFYYIGDYKTGATKFDPDEVIYGSSLQLPMYHYVLEKMKPDIAKDCGFAGFGIQQIDFTSLKSACAKEGYYCLNNYMNQACFSGVGKELIDAWAVLDRTKLTEKNKKPALAKTSTYFKTPIMMGSTEQKASKGETELDWSLKSLEETAWQVCLEVIHAIENGQYPIAPSSSPRRKAASSRGIACNNCEYRDVCYSKGIKDARQHYAYTKMKKGGEEDGVQHGTSKGD